MDILGVAGVSFAWPTLSMGRIDDAHTRNTGQRLEGHGAKVLIIALNFMRGDKSSLVSNLDDGRLFRSECVL